MKAKNNQQRAEALAGKIIQKEIVIPQGTPTNVDNPTTKAVLNTELQTANPTLQGNPGDGTSADPATGDFSHISYTGTLEAGKPASLAAVVQFAQTPKNLYGDPYSETVNDIQATLAGTPQQILDALAGEIDTAKTIKLPYGKTYDPTNATDAASISKTLKTANPLFKLPNNVTQTFSGGKIIMENDQPITISMNLKLGATTKSVSFPVGVNNI